MWRFRPTAFPIPPTVHQRIPTITKATIRRGCTTIERKHLAHGVAKATQSQYVTHAARHLTTAAHTPSNATPREPVPYPHQAIEAKWQEHWSKERAAEAASSTHTDAASRLLNSSKPPFYALSMFPYPSGALHMGHVRVYTISDTVARFMRMRGYEVLHPMGWDAFGLPAENAAIERGISPDTWTHQNIADMRKQMLALGLKFDWEAEIATCDPRYYKWTQWIFTQLHARGLAYQSDAGFVNWDPIDQTVLANEQVDNEGRSWRSGAIVEKKKLKQWYVRVTDYSDELLNDLSKLKGWPSQVKLMQKNWIGKSSGTKIVFELNAGSQASPSSSSTYELPVFTTRVDTLAGVTFIAVHISPFDRHPIIDQAVKDGTIRAEKLKEIQQYQEELNKMTDVQRNTHKAGVFTGLYAKHPLGLGDIPVYAASYVLSDYATGAVMGVPAHDTRDAAFAKCHGLESRVVIADAKSKDLDQPNSTKATVAPPLTSTEGVKLVNSGELDGLTPDEAATRIVAKLGQQCSPLTNSPVAESQSLYRLKDWLISRQRYWGAPIPIIHCPSCGPQSVPVEDLPVKLPELPRLSARGGSPLASTTCAVATEWRKCKCPKCGADSQRETDTLDTFVDSSWYFLRYLNRSSETAAFDPAVAKKFMPIPTYIGGIEHAILHLLYARFLTRFFYHIGLLSNPEPFDNLLTQGMVTGRTYKHPRTGKFIRESEVTFDGKTPFVIEKDVDTGVESKTQLNVVWEKMSKSKYNGVEPTAVTKVFGADCIRLFILFKAPPQQVLDWEEQQIKGQQRYIQRVWTHVRNHRTAMESNPELAKLLQTPIDPSTVGTLSPADQLLYNQTNEVITGVTTQIDDRIFNVAISLLMKFINQIDDYLNSAGTSAITSPVYHHALSNMTLLLAPMTPHLASESWEHLMNARYAGTSVPKQAEVVDSQSWPIASSTGLASSTLTAVLMVGKKRIGQIELPNGEVQQNEDKLKEAVINSPLGVETFAGASIKRVVCIRQKNNPSVVIMNFVLA